MVKVKAIKEIKENNVCVGFKLIDGDGKTMNIKSEAIKDAILSNKIEVVNLKLNSEGILVMVNEAEPKNENTFSKNEATINDEMKQLVDLLNRARKAYEQDDTEIMSNKEYDELYDKLVQMEKDTGITMSNSPTINVGYEVVSKLPKETHDKKMLSLAKTKERDDLVSFLADKDGALSWKMDGLTVVLTYEDGELRKAVTRGNGEVGELVTNNAKQFKNIPRKIAFKGKLVIRGEAIITYSSFEKINRSLGADEEKYKNPRNLCSGSVRQLDSAVTASRDVMWYAFTLVESEGVTKKTFDEQMMFLKLLGFTTVEYTIVNKNNINETIDKLSEIVSSKKLDIPTDGLVLTYNDIAYGQSLGSTAKTPRHSIAFKWQDEEAESELKYIEWQVGRSGVITPVAIFKPVDIEGSTVERASLHNLSIMCDLLGQPYIGQKIKVFKANMIIPQISWADISDEPGLQKLFIPSYCPCCRKETEIKEDPNSGVLTLWCTNPNCGEQGNRLFEHFVSRDAMNIDGLSTATLQRFSEYNLISDFASIYHLKDYGYEITNMEGFGIQSFKKLVLAIEKSRNVKPANLIYALGISNVGLATAKLICRYFNNDLTDISTATYNELVSIEGVGDVIAQSFVDYFEDSENYDNFIKLVRELNIIKEEVSTNTSMSGVTICVTGDVYVFPNRRAIKDLVENLGGKLTGSVSRSTSYLVTNDTSSGSNKNKAAQQYGIPILTEQEFIDKFNLSEYIN